MPRIEQDLIEPGSDMERALIEVRGRFVAKLGQPLQCEFEKFKVWLQAYVEPGGKLLGGCGVRAEALAPLLTKPGQKSGMVAALMKSPLKPAIEQKWESVETCLKRGQALVIRGRGTEVSGEESNFAKFTTFHAFVLLHVIADGEEKKWFIGFDPDVSATTGTRDLWNSLIRAAFETKDVELGKWNEQVKDLDRDKLHEILTTMILGTTPNGFGPLVRRYAIETKKLLEIPT